jgi:multidrug resistance efflux pump
MKHIKLAKIFILLLAVCFLSLLAGCGLTSGGDIIPVVAFTDNNSASTAPRITVNGVVESVESRNVYTVFGYTVDRVDVKIGDRVTEGQILAVLDTEGLELTIAQQRLEIATLRQMSELIPIQRRAELDRLQQMAELLPQQRRTELELLRQNNQIIIQESRRIYDEAYANLENNTNIQIISAEAALNAAEIHLTAVQRDYANAMSDFENGNNLLVINAYGILNNARIELETLETNHERLELLYAAGGLSRNELRQSENAIIFARNTYADARINHENAVLSEQRVLEQLDDAVQAAIASRRDAQIILNATRLATQQELDMLHNNITVAEIAANTEAMEMSLNLESREIANNIAAMELAINLELIELAANLERMEINLQILERQLSDSIIKSPISGTVTAVIAKEGAIGTGLLFTIEDTDNLRIITRFREYDITRIETGMAIVIQSDAMGTIVHSGTITRINPAAVTTTPFVEFEVEVAITTQNTGLRIGMNTRLEVLFEGEDEQ